MCIWGLLLASTDLNTMCNIQRGNETSIKETSFLRFLLLADVVFLLTTAARESFSGLKPSTLKQLGQTFPTITAKQVAAYTDTEK